MGSAELDRRSGCRRAPEPRWLILDYGVTGFGPAAPAAVHRDYVAVTHLLEIVGREGRTETAAAVENNSRVLVRDGFLNIPLDDAFPEVNRAGDVTAGPFG